jgi:hypothetical protein
MDGLNYDAVYSNMCEGKANPVEAMRVPGG